MKRWLLGLSLAFCGVTTGVAATLPPTVAALAEAADRRDADLSLWSAALASDDRSLQSAALRGLARIGGDDRLALLLPFLADDSAELRAEAAFAIGILDCQDPARQREQAQALLQQLTREPDSQVRSALLRALGNRGDDGSQQALRDYQLTGRDAAEQAAWAQAVGLLWSYRRGQLAAIDAALVDRLLALTVSAEPVAEMAAFALARARKETAVQARAGQLRHAFGASPSAGARLFLLRALAPTIASSASAAPWLRAQQRQRLGGRTLSAAERVELHAALVASLNGPALRTAVATGLRAPAAAERLAVLQALANRPVEAQTLRDVLQAHAGLQPVDQAWLAPLLEPAHADSVAEEEEPLEPVSATRPYAEAIQAVGVRYRLATVRGAIDIELLPDAVYTAANFATLADRGFYDQTRFHRVIGNFVAQGGDPTGTGSGGPGWRIREELSPLPHAPGLVGMATAGKDTGGSQFFFNTGRNPHLDGHYTIFAKVIAGQAVVQALLPGDQVLTVRRLP